MLNTIDVPTYEIITEIFGSSAKEALIASLPQNHEGGWPVKKWTGKTPRLENENYVVVSTFNDNDKGHVNRRGTNFKALYMIVLDDIGSKYDAPPGLWDEPSYKIRTSITGGVASEQWAYFLDVPITDANLARNLLRSMISLSGFSDKIGDLSRFVRLPGSNWKPGKDEATGREVRIIAWHPERRYSIEKMASWVGLSVSDLQNTVSTASSNPIQEIGGHPIVEELNSLNLLLSDSPNEHGWIDIHCPWEDLHTNATGTPTGVLIRDDGSWTMSCFHSGCKEGNEAQTFDNNRVLQRLEELGAKSPSVIQEGISLWSANRDFALIEKDGTEQNIRPLLVSRYAFLSSENRFWDLRLKYTVVPEALDTAWAHLLGPKERASKIIKVSPYKQVYGKIGFLTTNEPVFELDGTKYVNTYNPPKTKAIQGDVSLWTTLMTHIYGEYADLVINHMAYTCQFPERKIRWQVLCYGAPRTGKTLSVEPLRRIFSTHAKTIEVIADEKYDDAYVEAKVVVFEEVWGDRRNYNNLKSKLANSNIETLNPKSKPKVTQLNTMSIYMFSNHDNALQIDVDGDKLLVIQGPNKPLNEGFYTEFGNALFSGDMAERVYYFLLNRDLTNFSANKLPVRTAAAIAMANAGEKDIVELLTDMRESDQELFDYADVGVAGEEYKVFDTPVMTREQVRQFLLREKLWSKSLQLQQTLEHVGLRKLTQGQVKNYGMSTQVYLDAASPVHDYSTGDRFRWLCRWAVFNNRRDLISKPMHKFINDTGIRDELNTSELQHLRHF